MFFKAILFLVEYSSYKALNLGKLRYLAIVIESEEAYQTSKVIELLQWLEAIGVKRVCLYDTEGNGGLLSWLMSDTFYYWYATM